VLRRYPGGLIRAEPIARHLALPSSGRWDIREAFQTPKARFSWRAATGDEVDRSTYTFNTVDIGDPTADRLVIVAAQSTTTIPTAVTIDGISAVQRVGLTNSNTHRLAFWTARVPAGSTATIVLTMSGTAARAYIQVFAAYGIRYDAPIDFATTQTDNGSIAIDVPGRCIVLAASYTNVVTGGTVATWTGLTELYDGQPAAAVFYSAAGDELSTVEAARAVSCDWNNATAPVSISGVWI
jgi:hypothetical protein